MLKATLQYDEEALATLCLKRHVRRLDLFGSRAKGTARDGSDVDLLVKWKSFVGRRRAMTSNGPASSTG